ncbi:MAG TPA: TIGR03086 family protein, partial [Acidimicrobiaceae bacterium]|nr:TIGR03086 family protein [Acidimicrobiaceae bacterium]
MEPTTATTTTPAPFGVDDPRHVFGRAVAVGTATVAAVRPDQLDGPTPCSEMDVRHLLG